MHVYCELYSCLVSAEELGKHTLTAIILSGGPNSVYEEGAPHVSKEIWDLVKERCVPVLGICYGMQELAYVFGGTVAPGLKREYGKAQVHRIEGCDSELFRGLPQEFQMWMSHGDKLHKVPDGFKKIGKMGLFFHFYSFNYQSQSKPAIKILHSNVKCNHCRTFIYHDSWNIQCRLCCH